jgi:hypothetical protein
MGGLRRMRTLVRRVARLMLLDRLTVSPSVIGLLRLLVERLLAWRRSVRRLVCRCGANDGRGCC